MRAWISGFSVHFQIETKFDTIWQSIQANPIGLESNRFTRRFAHALFSNPALSAYLVIWINERRLQHNNKFIRRTWNWHILVRSKININVASFKDLRVHSSHFCFNKCVIDKLELCCIDFSRFLFINNIWHEYWFTKSCPGKSSKILSL